MCSLRVIVFWHVANHYGTVFCSANSIYSKCFFVRILNVKLTFKDDGEYEFRYPKGKVKRKCESEEKRAERQ